MPHRKLIPPSCSRQSATSPQSPIAVSSSLAPRLISIALSHNREDLNYALGTLGYRKKRNRKRTSTGELIWTDEADLVFALALIAWTTDRMNRVGTRRAVFLQRYLTRHGFTKTRKQIASRLQVLRGEWSCSSYLNLLHDPDTPSRRLGLPVSSPHSNHSYSAIAAPIPLPGFIQAFDQNVCTLTAQIPSEGCESHRPASSNAPVELVNHQPQPTVGTPYYTAAPPMAPFPVPDIAISLHTAHNSMGLSFHNKRMSVFEFSNLVSAPTGPAPYSTSSSDFHQLLY